MTILANAVSAGLTASQFLQLGALARLQALADNTIYASPGIKKVGWVDALATAGSGNGSEARPWATLEEAVAGIGALAPDADPTGFAPFVIVVRRGINAAPSKPFEYPVVLVLEEGASVTGTSIPAALPNRTATTNLPALFGVVATGAGPTTCAPFALAIGTGAYTCSIAYQGNGSAGGANGLSIGAVPAATGQTATTTVNNCTAASLASSGSAWVYNSTVAGAVTGTSVVAHGSTLGSTTTATTSLQATTSTLTGNVTCPAITLDDYSARRYQTGAITCSSTPTIQGAMAQGRVQGATVASAASPQTINFAQPFPVAPDTVVVTPAGAADATTFWRVSAITVTGFTIVWGGTDPLTWRYLALKSV